MAAALVLLLPWLDDGLGRWPLVAVGLCLGMGLGIKPSAGYIAVGAALAVGYHSLRHRTGVRRGLGDMAALTVATLLAGGAWYIRAYLLTGNPVFPFLNAIFRSPLWYAENSWLYSGGIGKGLSSLLTLPWRMTFETGRFGVWEASAGILLLAGLPLAGLLWTRARRLAPVAVICLVYYLLWFASAQNLRYLFPGLVGLAVISGWGIVTTWRRSPPRLAFGGVGCPDLRRRRHRPLLPGGVRPFLARSGRDSLRHRARPYYA